MTNDIAFEADGPILETDGCDPLEAGVRQQIRSLIKGRKYSQRLMPLRPADTARCGSVTHEAAIGPMTGARGISLDSQTAWLITSGGAAKTMTGLVRCGRCHAKLISVSLLQGNPAARP